MELDKFVLPQELLEQRPPRAQDRQVDTETADELVRLTGYGKPEIDESAKDAYTATVLGHSQFPVMASTRDDTRRRLLGVGLHGNAKAYVDGPDVKHQTTEEREHGAAERAEAASTQLAQVIVSAFHADENFVRNAVKPVHEDESYGRRSHLRHTVVIPAGAIGFMGGLYDDINKRFSSLVVSDDVNVKTGKLHSEEGDGRQEWLKQVFLLTHKKVKAALLEQFRITGDFKRHVAKEDSSGRLTVSWEDVKSRNGGNAKLPWGKDVESSETLPVDTSFLPRSITMTFKKEEEKYGKGNLQCKLDIFFGDHIFHLHGDIKTVEWASLDPEALAKSFVVPRTVTDGRPARRTDMGVDEKTYETLRDAPVNITSISVRPSTYKFSKELHRHEGYRKAFLAGSAMVLPDADLDVSSRERMEKVSDEIAAYVRSALEADTSQDVQDAVKACLFRFPPRSCDIFVEGPGREDPRSKWPYEMLGRVKEKLGTLLGGDMDVNALINTWL